MLPTDATTRTSVPPMYVSIHTLEMCACKVQIAIRSNILQPKANTPLCTSCKVFSLTPEQKRSQKWIPILRQPKFGKCIRWILGPFHMNEVANPISLCFANLMVVQNVVYAWLAFLLTM